MRRLSIHRPAAPGQLCHLSCPFCGCATSTGDEPGGSGSPERALLMSAAAPTQACQYTGMVTVSPVRVLGHSAGSPLPCGWRTGHCCCPKLVVMLQSDPFLHGAAAVKAVPLAAPLGSVPAGFVGGRTCSSPGWGGREGGSPCGCSQPKGGFSRRRKVSPTATAVAPTRCPAEISV